MCILRIRGLGPRAGLFSQDKTGPLQCVPRVPEGCLCVCAGGCQQQHCDIIAQTFLPDFHKSSLRPYCGQTRGFETHLFTALLSTHALTLHAHVGYLLCGPPARFWGQGRTRHGTWQGSGAVGQGYCVSSSERRTVRPPWGSREDHPRGAGTWRDLEM